MGSAECGGDRQSPRTWISPVTAYYNEVDPVAAHVLAALMEVKE